MGRIYRNIRVPAREYRLEFSLGVPLNSENIRSAYSNLLRVKTIIKTCPHIYNKTGISSELTIAKKSSFG
jgi:hypothetical protein